MAVPVQTESEPFGDHLFNRHGVNVVRRQWRASNTMMPDSNWETSLLPNTPHLQVTLR